MRTLLALLFCASVAFAEPGWSPNDLALLQPTVAAAPSGPSYIETNLATAVTGWYFPALRGLATNTYVYLPDCYTNGWDLTNASASSTWPAMLLANLNAKDVVNFIGANLRSARYTNGTALAHEICVVQTLTNQGAIKAVLDSHNSANRNLVLINPFAFQLAAPSGVTSTTLHGLTNQWLVINYVFNGSSSKIYTNGVPGGTINPGSQVDNGLTVGATRDLGSSANYKMALMVGFAGVLSTTDRANLVSELRTRFNF